MEIHEIVENENMPDMDRALAGLMHLQENGKPTTTENVAGLLGWETPRARTALAAAQERGYVEHNANTD